MSAAQDEVRMAPEPKSPEAELEEARRKLDAALSELEKRESAARASRRGCEAYLENVEAAYRKLAEHHAQSMSVQRLRLAGHEKGTGDQS